MLRDEGKPLHYPGSRGNVSQPNDTDLMAHAMEWAGHADAAQNQIFNIDNGEFFSIADQWPIVAECFGMEVGDEIGFSFLDEVPRRSADWDAIRARHDLIAPDIPAFLGQKVQFADWVFAFSNGAAGPPGSISTVKLRQAGFNEALHTDEMLRKWLARYQEHRLLPPR